MLELGSSTATPVVSNLSSSLIGLALGGSEFSPSTPFVELLPTVVQPIYIYMLIYAPSDPHIYQEVLSPG